MDKVCIFCKIAAGEIPSEILYQDEEVVAFRDIKPLTPVHLLVVSRKHIPSLSQMTDTDAPLIGHMTKVANQLAREQGIAESGYRLTINPDIGQRLEPTYMVLIDSDEREIEKDEFLVRESRLHRGSQPYRGKDFVLLKIAQGDRRTDEQTLPFYPLWETTREMATRSANDHIWGEAKAHFKTLNRALLDSPDLTKPDYNRLSDEYLAEVKEQRERAVSLSILRASSELSEEENRARQIADELDELDDL